MTAKIAPVLTVDGPSGSGKGTISRLVARSLEWRFLDSGALYRAVGLAASWADADFSDHLALAKYAADTKVRFEDRGLDDPAVFVNGVEAGAELRNETCAAAASAIAAIPGVRAALIDKQRAFRRQPGLVADGRDMGTIIFPDAGLKIFLTASAEERAHRRYKQLKQKGLTVRLADLLEEIHARDTRDAGRRVAPLKPAGDAVLLDSTSVPVADVVTEVLTLARQRFQLSSR